MADFPSDQPLKFQRQALRRAGGHASGDAAMRG